MKNIVEEKIDQSVTETPSFEETWNKVDTTKIPAKKKSKSWIYGIVGSLVAAAGVTAIVITATKTNLFEPKFEGVTLLRTPKKSEEYSYLTSEFLAKLNNFSAKFTDYAYQDFNDINTNLCVSPLSLYMATALLEECAIPSARTEIEAALGMTYDDILNNTKTLINKSIKEFYEGKKLMGKESITNSIWMDPHYDFQDDCLDSLAENYYCYPYAADFMEHNADANKEVRRFISDQTNGLIDHDWDFNEDVSFLLMNTLYWKDVWNGLGEELDKYYSPMQFTDAKGNKVDADFYSGYYFPGQVVKEEKYSHFYMLSSHGYKLKFVVPNDGYDLGDVWNAETVAKINSIEDYKSVDLVERKEYYTRAIFPEFEAESKMSLLNMFKNRFGIKEVMNNAYSLENIVHNEVVVGDIIQETKLKVDKKGGEGAAVTIVEVDKATSVGPEEEYEKVYQDFKVNKAFGYVLTDGYDVPLFSGVVNNI